VTLGSADPVPLEDKGDDDNNANNMSIDDVRHTDRSHMYTHRVMTECRLVVCIEVWTCERTPL
jgi:hypothetical protein